MKMNGDWTVELQNWSIQYDLFAILEYLLKSYQGFVWGNPFTFRIFPQFL